MKHKRRPRRRYVLLIGIVIVLILALALREVQPNMTTDCRGIDPQAVGSMVGMNQGVVECLGMGR